MKAVPNASHSNHAYGFINRFYVCCRGLCSTEAGTTHNCFIGLYGDTRSVAQRNLRPRDVAADLDTNIYVHANAQLFANALNNAYLDTRTHTNTVSNRTSYALNRS